jgi:hypothetical protein
MKHSYLPLKLVLALVAVIHIVVGLVGIIPGIPLSYILVFYGGALQFSPQIAYLLHIFAAYMLTMGALSIYALWDPVKNKSIVHCIIFLLLFRGIQRILYLGQLDTVFGMVPKYYWVQTILFLVVGVALLWLRPRAAGATKA